MISMLKIRRSCDRVIFNMEIPMHEKDGLYMIARRQSGPITLSATWLLVTEPIQENISKMWIQIQFFIEENGLKHSAVK